MPKTRPSRGRGSLSRYDAKRDFTKTPEPRGRTGAKKRAGLRYVVQKHAATRLHYDFRLEHDGVLKSWAVPKEPTLDTKVRRLAVRVEDHPLEYGGFEGEIPEGEYGAGSVVIWDKGSWEPVGDVDTGLREGKLDFILHGERLRGNFALVRMAERKSGKAGKENWLLLKRRDPSTPGRRAPKVARKSAGSVRADVDGARRGPLPRAPRPQLATPVTHPPEGGGWLLEQKLDGYRVLCRIRDGKVKALTRRGNDWTSAFAGIAEAASTLRCKAALIDGEAVVFDARGLTSFQRLQNTLKGGGPIVLVAFDLLHLDGWDLTGAPLSERKRLLAELLEGAPPALRFSEHTAEDPERFFEAACAAGLEGIIAKRADDPYRGARTGSWLKVKCVKREEFVVAGYTDPGGTRTAFGALLVATRADASAPLRFVGKVGTGFDQRTLKSLHARLRPLQRKLPAVDRESARGVGKGVHWVEPTLVAEIGYTQWTSDGRLRHPTFIGLREDKPAAEVTRERAVDPAELASPARSGRSASTATVELTHPDKVLFADPGITKRELAEYWESVADFAVPLLRGRPLTLRRCPDGYEGQCFWQRHMGASGPDAVRRVVVTPGEDPYGAVEDVRSLVALTQIGALELHVWGSRVEHLDTPDILVFDLDPGQGISWRDVVAAGVEVRDRLGALGLEAFAKLTGGKGLHVVVPVIPGSTWPTVRKFTRALVDEMVAEQPKRFLATMSKSKRAGKIYIDALRNDAEASAIGAYSPRARAGAPVALPVEWDDLLEDRKEAPRYGVREVPDLVRRRPRDPWAGFEAARRSLTG